MGKKILRLSDLTEVKVAEGPIPPGVQKDATRDVILRGKTLADGTPLEWGANDTRPGLPEPTSRKDVLHIQPQATTAAQTGQMLSPDSSWAQAGQASFLATGNNSDFPKNPGNPSMRGTGSMNDAQHPPTSGLGFSLSARSYNLRGQMQDEADRQ